MRRSFYISTAALIGLASAGLVILTGTNAAPVVSAGPDGSVQVGTPYTLAGSCTDDGRPNPPNSLTCTWSKTSGPGVAVFNPNTTTVAATVTPDTVGSYVVRLTGNDTALSTFDEMTLTVTAAAPWPGSYTCINPATGSGTHNYYLCDCQAGADAGCVAGSDANNGTNPATPWQTFAKAVTTFNNTSLVTAGDTINFCKGGVFAASGSSTRMKNVNCTAGNPCVFRDYQAGWGGTHQPVLTGGASGASVFEFSEGSSTNDDGGYAILNLHLHGVSTASGRGVFTYNDVDDLTVCGCEIEGFNVGVSIAGVVAVITPPCDGISSRTVVANNNIHGNGGWGTLGATPGWREMYNTFVNNGNNPHTALEHNVYLSEQNTGDNYSDEQIVGNDLTQAAYDGTNCNGVELVVHGNHTGLLIENNFIHELVGHALGGCYGIAVDTGYSDPESFTDTIIRGNIILNVGSVSIGTASWLRGIIENNVIVQNNTECSGTCGTTDISVPDTARGSNDQVETDVKVRNNTIFLGSQLTANGTAITIGGEGTGYVSANNTVHSSSTSTSWNCFDYGLPSTSYSAIDYNNCYFPNAVGADWENGTGSLAAWKLTAGSPDAHSISVDPHETNVGATPPNLAPSSGGLLNAGSAALGSTNNINGVPRTPPPNIGAY